MQGAVLVPIGAESLKNKGMEAGTAAADDERHCNPLATVACENSLK